MIVYSDTSAAYALQPALPEDVSIDSNNYNFKEIKNLSEMRDETEERKVVDFEDVLNFGTLLKHVWCYAPRLFLTSYGGQK